MSRYTLIAIIILYSFHTLILKAQNQLIYNDIVKFVQLYSAGDFKNAEECLLKILKSEEPISDEYLVSTYNNLGSVNSLLGKYNEALKYYHFAEGLVIDKKQFSSYLADIYINIGRIFGIKRSFPEAIEYLEKGIRIYSKMSNTDKRIFQNISTAYLNLGLTYYKIEDYKQALEYLQKSINLKLKWNLSEIALTYLNIAKVYAKLGDSLRSEPFFLKSIEEFEREYGPACYKLTSVFFDYGLFLSSVGREQESFEYYQRALAICLKTYSGKHPFVSLAYKHIGDHYMITADYNSALLNYQKSLIAGVWNYYDKDINSNPSLDSVLIDVDLLRSLQKKSEAFMLLALKQDKSDLSIKLMKKSLETIEVILQLISNIRNNYISEESRIYLAENEKETYFFATQIAQYLYSFTNDPAYIKVMYKIVLLGKTAVLRKGIEENRFFYSRGTPDTLKQKLDNLNTDIGAYRTLILEEFQKVIPDKIKLDFWKDTLFFMSIQKEKTLDEIIRIMPQAQQVLQKTEPISLEEIQSDLKKMNHLSNTFSQINILPERESYLFL
jgi:tetratricopeptide (TPR) repeat protein